MIIEKKGYSYNDLTIVPEVISDVSSRSECNPFIKENWLPIIASPMASVVNENNLQSFIDNGITPIVPRNIDLDRRKSLMNDKQWVALSLKEFEFCFITEANKRDLGKHYFICVDIANGHMKSLYLTCRAAKTLADKYGYILTIMTGNIANAETYKWISEFTYKDKNDKTHCVIDFIRVGIGGGSGCITTSNTSIHYPQASLIDECYNLKKNNMNYVYDLPKIVADGGVRNYDHVIKALALGADYVMIGGQFSKLLESAAEFINADSKDDKLYWSVWDFDKSKKCKKDNDRAFTLKMDKPYMALLRDTCRKYHVKLYKSSHGMSTQEAQKRINKNAPLKVSEGKTIIQESNMTISEWVTEFIAALTSAMSYCDCRTLEDFIGEQEFVVNSYGVLNTVNATNQ